METIINQMKEHPRYIANVQYGKPRQGHPEGTVAKHIEHLEENLETLRPRLDDVQYWKLMFLIHTHDSFKAESGRDLPITDPNSHASLARAFAEELTNDADLLNMIQYHDENFALWRQYEHKGKYNEARLEKLLDLIQDWNLFLTFIIIDGCTEGKDPNKVKWFINIVKQHKDVEVDESWVIERKKHVGD